MLALLLFAVSAIAQSPPTKLRDAQQAFASGDCARALPELREVIAADPQNYVAHLLAANCLQRGKDYRAAIGEFRRAVELRRDAAPALSGLIGAYALAGDTAHRDEEIEHLRALIAAGKVPASVGFVREQFTADEKSVVAREMPVLTLLRTRYVFDVVDAQQKPVRHLELVSREEPSAGPRQFSLETDGKSVRVYDRGEPAYAQVVADVKAIVAGRPASTGSYALAAKPAAVVPIPITIEDPADPRVRLQAGQVAIESIAHSCFRIHTAKGTRLLIDPFASRMWLGYDFPAKLAADAVLITHPHYDHDADVLLGHQPPPWASDVRVLRDPGTYAIGDIAVTGVPGKHADPWGKEFGQTNTIWLLDVDGLRIAHLGDNGPLTDANVRALGRVDILMIPIDAKHHILKDAEIDAIRKVVHPRVVIPMHYRIPELEPSPDSPEGLGEIGPWLAGQQNVVRLDRNLAIFSAASLLPAEVVAVFPHSPKVHR